MEYWKFRAIDKLKDYTAQKAALQSLPEEIARLESEAYSIKSATSDGTPVKGGGSGREDRLLSNIVKREEHKAMLHRATLAVGVVERGLAVLNREERLILDRFYIHPNRGNVDRLCEELMCEQATVYRRRDKALYHFTVCLYGCTES